MKSEARKEFMNDINEKAITARSSHYKKTGNSVSGFNNYSSRELSARNGEFIQYNMDKPMSWETFVSLDKQTKNEYILGLAENHGADSQHISEMFKIRPKELWDELHECGITAFAANFDSIRWNQFIGSEVFSHKPISWDKFTSQGINIQKMYINWLNTKYNPTLEMLGEMFGISPSIIYKYMKEKFNIFFISGGEKSPEYNERWESFISSNLSTENSSVDETTISSTDNNDKSSLNFEKLTWDEFLTLSNEKQKEYFETLIKSFKVSIREIAIDLFHEDYKRVYNYLIRKNIRFGKRGKIKPIPEWYIFIHNDNQSGSVKTVEKTVELNDPDSIKTVNSISRFNIIYNGKLNLEEIFTNISRIVGENPEGSLTISYEI